jgi:hypothetical protein
MIEPLRPYNRTGCIIAMTISILVLILAVAAIILTLAGY